MVRAVGVGKRGERPSGPDLDEDEVFLAEDRGACVAREGVFELDRRSELRVSKARN